MLQISTTKRTSEGCGFWSLISREGFDRTIRSGSGSLMGLSSEATSMEVSWLTYCSPKTRRSHACKMAIAFVCGRFLPILLMSSPSISSRCCCSQIPEASSATHSSRVHRFRGGSRGGGTDRVSVIAVGILLIVPALCLRLGIVRAGVAPARFGREADLFVPADAAVRIQTFQDKFGRRGPDRIRFARAQSQQLGLFEQSLNGCELLDHFGRRCSFVHLQRAPQFEPLHHSRHILAVENPCVDLSYRQANQLARDGVAALELALVLQLELAGNRGQRRVNIHHPRNGDRVADRQRPPLGVRNYVFQHRNRQALADSGALVDALVFTS